jgi:aryl-alcohol dehydrogenase-like predicted oxidoreductase
MQELRAEGKIELIGISNVGADTIRAALEVTEIASVQNAYSVLDRTHEAELELSRERGVAFVPFFPLGSAFTGGPTTLAADPAIAGVAARHGATAAQIALAWLLTRGEHVLLIPGTATRGHLEENLAAAEIELSGEDLASLEHVRAVGNPLDAGHE